MPFQYQMNYQTLGAKFTSCKLVTQNTKTQNPETQKQSKNLHIQIMLGEMKRDITEITGLKGLYQVSQVPLTLVGTTT